MKFDLLIIRKMDTAALLHISCQAFIVKSLQEVFH